MGKIGQFCPHHGLKQSTDGYAGLPLPTRWSMQRSQYKGKRSSSWVTNYPKIWQFWNIRFIHFAVFALPGGFELCWNDIRPKKCNRVPCVSDIIHVYCAQEKREYFSKGALENNIWPFNKKSYNYKQWWGSWKWPLVGTLGIPIYI